MDTNAFSLASGNVDRYRSASTLDRCCRRVAVTGSLPALELASTSSSNSDAESATDASDEYKSWLWLLANRLAMVVAGWPLVSRQKRLAFTPTICPNRNKHWVDCKNVS